MNHAHARIAARLPARLLGVAVALLVVLAMAPPASATTDRCDGQRLSDGCLVTITGGDTADPSDGFLVADRDGAPFWSYYQAQGPARLGYPVSQPFSHRGRISQAFQKAIVQWRPDLGRMLRLNTLDILAADYPGVALANVPAHRSLPDDAGASFAQVTQNHLALLDADPDLRAWFVAQPDWLDRFGLPIAYGTFADGALGVLRAQRGAVQVWRDPSGGGDPAVRVQNLSDALKALTNVVIPDAAEAPVTRDVALAGLALTSVPLPLPVPPAPVIEEAAQAAVPVGPGLSGYGMQAEFRRSNDFGLIDLVKGAGFGWIKQQVTWADVELKPGGYSWREMDRLINNMHDGGVNILLSVIKTPDFYKPASLAGQAGPPTDMTKFHRFMFLLAQRYRGKVQAYEIWNEPNFAREWGSVPSGAPAQYLSMLRLGYRAVKEADPGATVVSGALTPTGVNDPAVAVDDVAYLRRLLAINGGEAGRYFDALGVHATAGPNAPDDSVANPAHSRATCGGGWSNHPSFFFTRYQELYTVLREAGLGTKPVWITEFGWPVAPNPAAGFGYAACISEQDQATFLVRAIEKARTETPYVTHMFVWNLNFQQVFGPDDERWAFAIVRADQSPRPAYLALQALPKG